MARPGCNVDEPSATVAIPLDGAPAVLSAVLSFTVEFSAAGETGDMRENASLNVANSGKPLNASKDNGKAVFAVDAIPSLPARENAWLPTHARPLQLDTKWLRLSVVIVIVI